MKIDIIITNPPYQLKTGGFGAQAKPIYHLFVEQAKKMAKHVCMIIPSRWFAGGMGLDKFREDMLKDEQIREIVDHPNAQDCFPGVEIKGGICYFLWTKDTKGLCNVTTHLNGKTSKLSRNLAEYEIFIRHNEALPIIDKVLNKTNKFLDKCVSSSNPFNLATNWKPSKSGEVTVFGNKWKKTCDRKEIIVNRNLIDQWKVLLSLAYGAGEGYPHQIIGIPIIAPPKSACTMTYIIVSVFDSEDEAKNLKKFLETKMCRFLISLRKNTQHTTKERFKFVPKLPMNETWTDEKLYSRYGITEDEQSFIEAMVKEMG